MLKLPHRFYCTSHLGLLPLLLLLLYRAIPRTQDRQLKSKMLLKIINWNFWDYAIWIRWSLLDLLDHLYVNNVDRKFRPELHLPEGVKDGTEHLLRPQLRRIITTLSGYDISDDELLKLYNRLGSGMMMNALASWYDFLKPQNNWLMSEWVLKLLWFWHLKYSYSHSDGWRSAVLRNPN